MPQDPFVTHSLDLLSGLGAVRARAMFGGHGLYLDGLMFALVADGELYLKVDDENRADFEAAGSEPFTWKGKDGRRVTMSYWRMPEDGAESPDGARPWGESALGAAERSKRNR